MHAHALWFIVFPGCLALLAIAACALFSTSLNGNRPPYRSPSPRAERTMWRHRCIVERSEIWTEPDHPCNWCGATEDSCASA